jgi:hypothetical protein
VEDRSYRRPDTPWPHIVESVFARAPFQIPPGNLAARSGSWESALGRAHYQASIDEYLRISGDEVLGTLTHHSEFSVEPPQRNTWCMRSNCCVHRSRTFQSEDGFSSSCLAALGTSHRPGGGGTLAAILFPASGGGAMSVCYAGALRPIS